MYTAKVCGEILKNGIPVKQFIHHTGYLCFSMNNRQERSHRFIWKYLVGEIPEGMVINHLNGNKQDNRLENLECVTPQENTLHAYRTGLMKGSSGEENSMAKLSNKSAFELFTLLPSKSNSELGALFNLHPRYISLIRHKRRWKALWKEYEGSETISKESRAKRLEAPSSCKTDDIVQSPGKPAGCK